MTSKGLSILNGIWLFFCLFVLCMINGFFLLAIPLYNYAIVGYLGNNDYSDKKKVVYFWAIFPSSVFLAAATALFLTSNIGLAPYVFIIPVTIVNFFFIRHFGFNATDNFGDSKDDRYWVASLLGVPLMAFLGFLCTVGAIRYLILGTI